MTIAKPTLTAITVVIKYVVIVIPPIFESLEISFKSEIPLIKDARINGIAINFRALIKIVPKGFIQFEINSFPVESKLDIKKPNKTPRNIPKIIFQCSGRFLNLILFLFY